ncbi:hypothetical protein H2204_001708 [Knufia peltigerae]|uniref:Enoyl reductase (ER) domain-containing protein n=1 Tax=Knufia peltigerae TaxID=1002370 RepID=A0AA39D3B3_9EURO|nr:hypothetical protein H2204_001708 [Knufia peltigerae]
MSTQSSYEYPALVSYEPNPKPVWKLEKVKIPPKAPGDHQVKVRLVATGICHSDIIVGSVPGNAGPGFSYPRILGHEGVGIVEEVGSGVTTTKVGDKVILSYNYCGNCDLCRDNKQPYCLQWVALNIVGKPGLFEDAKSGETVTGGFFGQSSFAGASIVSETSVVNVTNLIENDNELRLFAPLGCGVMTGSGAVLNGAEAKTHDIVMVTGLGGVGLGAVMAAKIAGCREVIAVDRIASRLDLARQLGATKVIDTSAAGEKGDLVGEAARVVNGQRISIVIETTGAVPVIEACMKAMGKRGRHLQLGVPPPGTEFQFPLSTFFSDNKRFECHYLGETTGQEQIPKMIEWYRDGKLPLEKFVKFFPASDAMAAMQSMQDGSSIKAVIVW